MFHMSGCRACCAIEIGAGHESGVDAGISGRQSTRTRGLDPKGKSWANHRSPMTPFINQLGTKAGGPVVVET